MAGKLSGNAIVSGSVTSTQLSSSVNNSIAEGGGPRITQIQITDSSYNVLDDTAVSTSGGYIKITGTGFAAGAQVIINTTNATSVAFVSSTVLNVQVPALAAGTYVVYVVNTNGGVGIAVNGLTYSGTPTWVTGSTLPNGTTATAISIQLSATGDAPLTYALQAGSTLPTGLTLTSGGLLSGTVNVAVETVYNFTVVATDQQLQDSPRAFSITIIVGDPYFYLTTLLLPGNGTNNGTNNTFLDSSTNAYTVTRVNNPTQGTFSPFSLTGWSNYFDGSGDYISTSAGAANGLGAGNFTIEAWLYYNAISGYQRVFCQGSTASGEYLFLTNPDGSTDFCFATTSILNFPAGTFTAGVWTHVAIVRSGSGSNNLKGYKNGVSVATGTNTQDFNATTATYIGLQPAVSNQPFAGYVSNYRVVKGTAVYTSNFTPPTSPLTAIANTSLLTCQSNRFIDNSTNNFTITRNGDVSVQSFSPFAPGSNYSTSTVGGSIYIDGGTGDTVSTVNTPANFGSGDFTIETWVWFTTNSVGYQPILTNAGSGDYQGWVIITETTNVLNFLSSTNGSGWTNNIGTGVIPTTNCWTHFAVVRNGGTITFYINGVASGTTAISGALHSPGTAFYVGYYPYFPGGARTFNGYQSGTRLVKGTAVYTSNFTPPTSPPTAVANTSLLLNYTNAQITDATSKNDLETVADAKISTAQSKWGGSSMYFDGTGDILTGKSNILCSFDTGNFTIEGWIYPSATTGTDRCLWDTRASAGDAGMVLFINSTANLSIYTSAAIRLTSSGTVTANTWQHIALVRSSGTVAFYINGTQSGTASYSSAITCPGRITVAGRHDDGALYTGYMNDLRVTKGYARYTTNFTPPASAFPTL